jgi:hypothetical protein
MPNLAIEKKIVKQVLDLNPVDGHDLVISKVVDGKKQYIAVKADEQVLEKRKGRLTAWLAKETAYDAYAVNMDEYLDMEFTRLTPLTLRDKIKDVYLTFQVDFQVLDSERLVRCYVTTGEKDPVTRLQKLICDTTKNAFSDSSWNMVRQRFNEVRRDIIPEVLELIEGRASYLGLKVKSINLSLQLTEKDKRFEETLLDIDNDETIEERKIDRDTALSERRKRLALSKAGDQFLEAAVKAVQKSLDNIGDNTESVDDLVSSARKLITLFSNPLNLDAAAPPTLLGASRPGPSGYISDATGRLKDKIDSTFETIRQIDCDAAQRKNLLSAILYLVAELVKGEQADKEKLDRHGDNLKGLLGELRLQGVPQEQLDRLIVFLNYDAMKEFFN